MKRLFLVEQKAESDMKNIQWHLVNTNERREEFLKIKERSFVFLLNFVLEHVLLCTRYGQHQMCHFTQSNARHGDTWSKCITSCTRGTVTHGNELKQF